ncbi:MAG TPA: hypothetical protein VH741_03375, partial [Candidatus Limnocylindrales bacterium]
DTEIRLDAGDDDSWQVPVACAEMRRDQPSDSDVFSLRPSTASGELRRLLNTRDFSEATFRVQQFAIWTITNNPRRGGYVALGSILNAAGPTDGELTAIRDLFEAAGLDTRDYRALR